MGNSKIWGLIPAAGIGARMGGVVAKQYLALAGSTVVEQTLNRIGACPSVDNMLVAVAAQDHQFAALAYQHPKLHRVIIGGAQRADSVRKLLQTLLRIEPQAWALVHDAVRPCVRVADVESLVQMAAAKQHGGLLATPLVDSVKLAATADTANATADTATDTATSVSKTIPRAQLWRAFTPQLFKADELLAALANNATAADESAAIEHAGGKVFLLASAADNLKITHPADLPLAELILAAQAAQNKLNE